MIVLGIETSCDETSVAIYDEDKGLLINKIYSQIKLHAKYGGVVPELAARDHIKKLLPLINEALIETNLTKDAIDGIAYTAGPGMLGCLLIGASVAKALAFAWNKTALAINHMEGHLLSPIIENNEIKLPFIALLVSGGHTQLIEVKALGDYHLLGETLDDAVGEAFDKVGKLLGLEYPAGATISKLAKNGDPTKIDLPRPMLKHPGLDFSFSGLKTAVLHYVTKKQNILTDTEKADLLASFQQAVIETLVAKSKKALKQTNFKTLVVAGGVSANLELRKQLGEMTQKLGAQVFFADLQLCTDNAGMIAFAGFLRLKAEQDANLSILVKSKWPVTDLAKIN